MGYWSFAELYPALGTPQTCRQTLGDIMQGLHLPHLLVQPDPLWLNTNPANLVMFSNMKSPKKWKILICVSDPIPIFKIWEAPVPSVNVDPGLPSSCDRSSCVHRDSKQDGYVINPYGFMRIFMVINGDEWWLMLLLDSWPSPKKWIYIIHVSKLTMAPDCLEWWWVVVIRWNRDGGDDQDETLFRRSCWCGCKYRCRCRWYSIDWSLG